MGKDFLKKEPTKSEKMIYELAMNQHQMEKAMWSTSTVVMALAMLSKVSPEDLAKQMFEDEKIKAFSQQVNEVIKKLEASKNSDADKQSTGQ